MTHTLPRDQLGRLFEALHARGYEVVGPTVRDRAIVYEVITSPDELPIGWTDEQAPGKYRLKRRDDDAYFGYAVGPHSWKAQLFPSRETLLRTRGSGPAEAVVQARPRAFLGVRACELAAIAIQDRVFTGGPYVEPRYAARREQALMIAVNCGEPAGLCFCVSMETGPRVKKGAADLVLTELPDRFVLEAGSDRGRDVLDALPTAPATVADEVAADSVCEAAAARMGRALDTENVPGVLFANLDHARWDDVAKRCLSCGNCTQVCPTCFCSSVTEVSDLDLGSTARVRTWDSCFVLDHSTIHGATFRPATKQRYRQWLTHKFGSWVSQYGVSGCVGCGRCIAWCPVGIDVTEEIAALRDGNAPVATPAPPAYTKRTVEPLVPADGVVRSVKRETADVVTLEIAAPVPPATHGQFNMVGLPGYGEVPISVSETGRPEIVHTIRAVGAITNALTALEPGARVQVRGPYGVGWPLDELRGRPVVVVAGGLGLAPLRSAIRALLAARADVRLFYGARQPSEVLFPDDLRDWARVARVEVTVDRADPGWTGHVGVVPRLLRPDTVPADAGVLVCGPEIMMRYTLQALAAIGVPDDRIWLSMERHMKCAAGFCGRCQYAHFFVCKDGPVFRYDVISQVFDRDGF